MQGILKRFKKTVVFYLLPWTVDFVISFFPKSNRASIFVDRLILMSEAEQ